MIAVDTGFVSAPVDKRDAWHERARARLPTAGEGWITTWPALTEATPLMTRWLRNRIRRGAEGRPPHGRPCGVAAGGSAVAAQAALVRGYAKLPMDLADATFVVLAEHLGDGRILSTDERDFRTYRWRNRKPLHNLLARAAGV